MPPNNKHLQDFIIFLPHQRFAERSRNIFTFFIWTGLSLHVSKTQHGQPVAISQAGTIEVKLGRNLPVACKKAKWCLLLLSSPRYWFGCEDCPWVPQCSSSLSFRSSVFIEFGSLFLSETSSLWYWLLCHLHLRDKPVRLTVILIGRIHGGQEQLACSLSMWWMCFGSVCAPEVLEQ